MCTKLDPMHLERAKNEKLVIFRWEIEPKYAHPRVGGDASKWTNLSGRTRVAQVITTKQAEKIQKYLMSLL